MTEPIEILKKVHAELSENSPKDWKRFDEIMEDGTGSAMLKAMEEYSTSKSKEDNLSLMEEIEKLKKEIMRKDSALLDVTERAIKINASLSEAKKDNKMLQGWYDGQCDTNEHLRKVKSNLEGLFFKKKEDFNNLKSQLAEAKKEIEELKWDCGKFLTEHLKLQSQLQESEERNKQFVEALEGLCQLKIYKDDIGKDNYYNEQKPKVWSKAMDILKDNNKQK